MTGRLIGGRYRLLARRGAGATSAVFTGVDVRDHSAVAVKLLHPALSSDEVFAARFTEEMSNAQALEHPNLVGVLGFGTEIVDGRTFLYVASEQVTGGSLQDIMDRGRTLAPNQALVVGLGACRGLDFLHRNGFVHHDVRPGSLLFGADRMVRLADIGLSGLLAELAWEEPSAVELERARFASPEQGLGAEVGPRTDVYSLALTLVASITGNVPFSGDSTTAMLANRVGKLLPVTADLGGLASVLERAARPDAEERATAAQFGRGLMQAAANLDRPAPIPIVVTTPPPGAVDHTGAHPTLASLANQAGAATTVMPEAAATQAIPATPTPGPATQQVPAMTRTPTGATARPTLPAPRPPRDPSGAVPRPPLYDEEPVEPVQRSRRKVWWGLAAAVVAAAVAIGAVVFVRSMDEKSYVVPALTGLSEGEAQNLIAGNGWEISTQEERNDEQPAGHVIRTEPAEGVELKEGEPFTIVLSQGPTLSPLPEINGIPLAEAAAALTAAGLQMQEMEAQFDEVVPEGVVISWTVPEQSMLVAGDDVQKGTTVQVVASKGAAPREVPDMVNVGIDESLAALEREALVVNRLPDEFNPTVPAGVVIRQDPPGHTMVPRGTVVTIVVSLGPDNVVLPDLGPLDHASVLAALTNAGFQVGVIAGDTSQPLQNALIDGASGVAGQAYPRNTVVNLVYPEPSAPAEPPAG